VKTLAIILWAGKLVASLALLVGAAIQIESILVLGPLLAIIGLMLGLVSLRLESWPALVFALSGPSVTAIVALMIAVFEFGPPEAQTPVVAVLSVYLLFLLPLAGFTLIKIRRWKSTSADLAAPWQFSLKTLLIGMTGVCLFAASAKLLADAMYLGDHTIFGGYAIVVFALSAAVVWRFSATHKPAPEPEPNAGDEL
jgi:hypothetical protein